MAKKDNSNRLIIPAYIWDCLNFPEETLFFYIAEFSTPRKVEILNVFEEDKDFIGKCKVDYKHRFILLDNIEIFLGADENSKYFFSVKKGKLFLFLS